MQNPEDTNTVSLLNNRLAYKSVHKLTLDTEEYVFFKVQGGERQQRRKKRLFRTRFGFNGIKILFFDIDREAKKARVHFPGTALIFLHKTRRGTYVRCSIQLGFGLTPNFKQGWRKVCQGQTLSYLVFRHRHSE